MATLDACAMSTHDTKAVALVILLAALIAIFAIRAGHHSASADPMSQRLDRVINSQGTQCWQTPDPWVCDPADYDNYGSTPSASSGTQTVPTQSSGDAQP
jgi:hypothetical protein